MNSSPEEKADHIYDEVNEKEKHEENTVTEEKKAVLYGVEDTPAPHLCFLFAVQQAIMCIGGVLSIPFIVTSLVCAKGQEDVISELLSITLFMCGLATFLQSTFGIRLGIIQGGSHTFIAPIVAMVAMDRWKCRKDDPDFWKEIIREISGNLMIASVTQLVIGGTGIMGFLLKYIGPLTIAPTISLIGLSLTGVASSFNQGHWGIAFMTIGLIAIFSLYLGTINLPICAWKRGTGCYMTRYPIFQLLPVILSIGITWLLCYILTVANVFSSDPNHINYVARTDARNNVLKNAPWFRWPVPFPFGWPTVSAAGYVGFLAATLSSIIESVGDYFAAARLSCAPPPPAHALNRGIAMEGFCSIFSGMVGAAHATTSYSGNIGAIGITKVASRRVFQTAGIIMVVCGIIGKVGAVITLIPEPIIGGTLTVVFGMVSAVGISTLKFIDMGSTRNMTIFGISLLLGLMVPQWINDPRNAGAIHTGNDELDQVINVLLGTAMFVGGFIGCLLDNTVPGTMEERGLITYRKELVSSSLQSSSVSLKIYELPFITRYLRKINCMSYFPLSPTFNKDINLNCCQVSSKPDVSRYTFDNDVRTESKSELSNVASTQL
ncbi:hypothetical protein ACJMK2_005196 [Sinanodonta woodiana]|uniref:Solute carrier family 23 member 2 n=1 Tax=Sinanodonta woodiana TaxID=1069815 RepID=A0ABD3VSR9_SINWO